MPMTDSDRIDRLAERVEFIIGQIGPLRQDVNTLKGDVVTLKEDVTTLKEDVGTLRAEVRVHHSELRAEMIDRDSNLLKWLLGFFVAQTAALGALMAAFR